jgi:hypothetical protein
MEFNLLTLWWMQLFGNFRYLVLDRLNHVLTIQVDIELGSLRLFFQDWSKLALPISDTLCKVRLYAILFSSSTKGLNVSSTQCFKGCIVRIGGIYLRW